MRDRLGNEITNHDVIPKLLELFSQCEDLEDDEGLGHLFSIFKSMRNFNPQHYEIYLFMIIRVRLIRQKNLFVYLTGLFSLNDMSVTDALCKPDSILDVIGMVYLSLLFRTHTYAKYVVNECM